MRGVRLGLLGSKMGVVSAASATAIPARCGASPASMLLLSSAPVAFSASDACFAAAVILPCAATATARACSVSPSARL